MYVTGYGFDSSMRRSLLFVALTTLTLPINIKAQTAEESLIKFAFYSPSWGSDTDANLLSDLRLIMDNQTASNVRIESISFQ